MIWILIFLCPKQQQLKGKNPFLGPSCLLIYWPYSSKQQWAITILWNARIQIQRTEHIRAEQCTSCLIWSKLLNFFDFPIFKMKIGLLSIHRTIMRIYMNIFIENRKESGTWRIRCRYFLSPLLLLIEGL